MTAYQFHTRQLVRPPAGEFRQRPGARPNWTVNRLLGRTFDGTRDLTEATGLATVINASWTRRQVATNSGLAGVARRRDRGVALLRRPRRLGGLRTGSPVHAECTGPAS